MTCILFNEAVGNAIVDAAIPAIYSAILVLGAYLFSISLLALLLTFFLVLAAANYWAFVYRPASLAHSRRKRKLRTIRHGDTQASQMNRTRRSSPSSGMTSSAVGIPRSVTTRAQIWKIFNIIKRSVQHGITLISFRRIRHIKNRAMKREWCDMNRSSKLQAIVLPIKTSQDFGSRDTVTNTNTITITKKSMKRVSSQPHSVPSPVTDMMTSSNLIKTQSSHQMRSSLISLFIDIPEVSDQRVLTTAGSFKIQRTLVPHILLDARHFLSFLKSKLIDTSVHSNDEPLEVRETDLCRAFIEILDNFYPDGMPLSFTEKDEACELYNTWKESVETTMNSQSPHSSSVEVLMVHFVAFESWFNQVFMSIIRSTLSDRLLDNSLRHPLNSFKNTSLHASTSSHNMILPYPVVRERKISVTTIDGWASQEDPIYDYLPVVFTLNEDQDDDENENENENKNGNKNEIKVENENENENKIENKKNSILQKSSLIIRNKRTI